MVLSSPSPTPSTGQYSIEMSQDVLQSKYGVIHKKGCRDLRDPLDLGSPKERTRESITLLADEETGWGVAEDGALYSMSPCTGF